MRTKIRFGAGFERRQGVAEKSQAQQSAARACSRQVIVLSRTLQSRKLSLIAPPVSMDIESAHLLVVDDDAELRELTQEYLRQQGFQCRYGRFWREHGRLLKRQRR